MENPQDRQTAFLPKVRIHPKKREKFIEKLTENGRDIGPTLKNFVDMYLQNIITEQHFERIQHSKD